MKVFGALVAITWLSIASGSESWVDHTEFISETSFPSPSSTINDEPFDPSPSPTENCPESCPVSHDKLCYYKRDLQGCYCALVCCDIYCEGGIDLKNCNSCSDCPCLSIENPSYITADSTATSPEFLSTEASSETSLPSTSELSSETSVETSPSADCSKPCPVPHDYFNHFCHYERNKDCNCVQVCCDLPKCGGSDIDWKNCYSCEKCNCLPVTNYDPSEISTPATSKSPTLYCYFAKSGDCSCSLLCCYTPQCEAEVSWPNCTSPDICPCVQLTKTSRPKGSYCFVESDQNGDCFESCCDLPKCEGSGIDWENCKSCERCLCLPMQDPNNTTATSTPTATTPECLNTEALSETSPSQNANCNKPCPVLHDNFCHYEKDPDCNCVQVCCGIQCEFGVDSANCLSCSNCPCLQPSSTSELSLETAIETSPSATDCSEPCPISQNGFCYFIKDEVSCQCYEVCCALPFCEGGIDWENCLSCSHCPCLTVTLPTLPSCWITCQDKPGCTYSINYESCSCDYDCPTPPTKKLKCFPVTSPGISDRIMNYHMQLDMQMETHLGTQPIKVNKYKWSDLDQETKETILNGNVSFQGVILKVSQLLDDLDELDDLDLDAIINQEVVEIAEPIKLSRDYDERVFIHRNFFESEMSRQESIKKVFSTQHFDYENLMPLKVIYVSNLQSMGKSTALHNIALQIKQKNPRYWVVTLDLKKCQKSLLEDTESIVSGEEAIQFLIDELLKPKHPKIFRKLFEDQRVVLMLDSLGDKSQIDDCSFYYTERLIALLAKTSVKQIWCTTSYGMYTGNQKDVNLAVTMKPFDRNDQVEYLVKYWRTTVECADLKEEDLRVIATEVILKQESSVENKVRLMIGEIFMSFVLAEVFSPLISNGTVSFPDDFGVGWIFERFIQGRFSKVNSKEMIRKVKQAQQYLAVQDIFGKTNCMEKYDNEFTSDLRRELKSELTNEDFLKPGLVYRQANGKLKFLHKTVCFYFVADWLVERYLDSRFTETYDDNDNDEFVIDDTYNIMNWINLVANRKRCLMTPEEAANLGNDLIRKQRNDKNTLEQIFIELYHRNFINLFKIILDSFSQPRTAKFIDKYFDDMFYLKDDCDQCLISVFDAKSVENPMLKLKGRFVIAMMEWASKHLEKDDRMNLKRLLASKNDRLESPLFWILGGDYNALVDVGPSFWLLEEISLIGYKTIRSLGKIYKEAFADDKEAIYLLLLAEKGETIFFRTPWKFEVFKALLEVVEEIFGKSRLIDLLTKQDEENRVFTHKIDFRGNSDYQKIWILIRETLNDESIFNSLLIRKQEKIESLKVILRCGNSEIFELGWKALQQFSTPEELKETLLKENEGICLNVFMSTISNPDLKVFESFLEKKKALSNNDPEIIDKTFLHASSEAEREHRPYRVAFMTPLFQAVETHLDMAEFWLILKRQVADIRVVTRTVLELKHPSRHFLHIYIEKHHKNNDFEKMLAKFWRTLRKDLDSTTIDSLLFQRDFSTGIVKLSFYESFEYYSEGFKENILAEDDIKRVHNKRYTPPTLKVLMERIVHDANNYTACKEAAGSSTTRVTAQTSQSVPTTMPVLIELQEIQRELAEIPDLPEAINKVKELIVKLRSAKSTDEKARVIATFYGIQIDVEND